MTEVNPGIVTNSRYDREKKSAEEQQTLSTITSSRRYTRTANVEDVSTTTTTGRTRRRRENNNNTENTGTGSSTTVSRRTRRGRPGSVSNRYIKRFDKNKDGVISDQEAFEYIERAKKYRSRRGLSTLFKYNDNAKKIDDLFASFDSSNNGLISNTELAQGVLNIRKNNIDIADEVKQVFLDNTDLAEVEAAVDSVDIDSNGEISDTEAINSLLDLRKGVDEAADLKKSVAMTNANAAEFEQFIAQVDTDTNGVVSETEIKTILDQIQIGNFTPSQVQSLEKIMSSNANFQAIKDAHQNSDELKEKASIFINEYYEEALLGSVNNGDPESNPSLFTVLYDLAEHLGADFTTIDIDPASYQFGGLVGKIQDQFEALGYQGQDFLGKPVDSLELGFIASQLPATQRETAKEQEALKLIDELIEQISAPIQHTGPKPRFVILEQLAAIFGDEIDADSGIYSGKTGAIQKNISNYFGLDPEYYAEGSDDPRPDTVNYDPKDVHVLSHIKENLEKAINGESFDYANKNLKEALSAKDQIKELQLTMNMHKASGIPPRGGFSFLQNQIDQLNQNFFADNPLNFHDMNIAAHLDAVNLVVGAINDLRAGDEIPFKNAGELKQALADFFYSDIDNSTELVNSIITFSDDQELNVDNLSKIKINLQDNLINFISEKTGVVPTGEDLKVVFDELKQSGKFNFLEKITGQAIDNDSLSSLITARALLGKNPDEVVLGLGLNLSSEQKINLIQEIGAVVTELEQRGISKESMVKYLKGFEDLSSEQDPYPLFKKIDLMYHLDELKDQVILGGSEGIKGVAETEQTVFGLLDVVSHKLDLNYSIEDILGMVNSDQEITANDPVAQIIKGYLANGKKDSFGLGIDAMPLDQGDIEIFRSVLSQGMEAVKDFDVYDAKHISAKAKVSELIDLYLEGDQNTLSKSVRDVIKDLADVYGEEFDPTKRGVDGVDQSFIESLLKGTFDFGSFDENNLDKISIEVLMTLKDLFDNLTDSKELPEANLFEYGDKKQATNFLINVLQDFTLGSLKEVFEQDGNTTNDLFKNINHFLGSSADEDHALVTKLKAAFVEEFGEGNKDINEEHIFFLINEAASFKDANGNTIGHIIEDFSQIRSGIDNSIILKNKNILALLDDKKPGAAGGLQGLLDEIADFYGDGGVPGGQDWEGLTGALAGGLKKAGLNNASNEQALTQEAIDYIQNGVLDMLQNMNQLGYNVLSVDQDPAFVKDDLVTSMIKMPRATGDDIKAYLNRMVSEKLDPSGDGFTSALDVLLLINNQNGTKSTDANFQERYEAGLYDFNADGVTDSKDSNILINFLDGKTNFDEFVSTEAKINRMKALPRTTGQEMLNYVKELQKISPEIKTNQTLTVGKADGTTYEREATIFDPSVWLNYFNGMSNDTVDDLFATGLLDVNNDGQVDAIDYYSVMKGYNNKALVLNEFNHIISSPSIEQASNFLRTNTRQDNDSINRYIDTLDDFVIDPGLSGVINKADLNSGDVFSLRRLVNGQAASNPRAEQAFEAGIYDLNNDGKTDLKDVEILNRYVSGNKEYNDLFSTNNAPQAKTDYYSIPDNGIVRNWTGGLDEAWLRGEDGNWYFAIEENGLTSIYPWTRGTSKEDTIASIENQNPIASFYGSLYTNIINDRNIEE